MLCFTRFLNNTSSPVISVSVDDSRIFSDILCGDVTTYVALHIGTREIEVFQNNNKQYLNASISLPPLNRCTVIIDDTCFTIIPD